MPYPPFPITKNGKTYLKWKDIDAEFGKAIPDWAKKLASPVPPVSRDPSWEVRIWWEGQQRAYRPSAPSKSIALRRAILDLASDLGLETVPLLRKIQANPDLFTVKRLNDLQSSTMFNPDHLLQVLKPLAIRTRIMLKSKDSLQIRVASQSLNSIVFKELLRQSAIMTIAPYDAEHVDLHFTPLNLSS